MRFQITKLAALALLTLSALALPCQAGTLDDYYLAAVRRGGECRNYCPEITVGILRLTGSPLRYAAQA